MLQNEEDISYYNEKAANNLLALSCIGEVLNLDLFKKLIGILCNNKICTGNTDEEYMSYL